MCSCEKGLVFTDGKCEGNQNFNETQHYVLPLQYISITVYCYTDDNECMKHPPVCPNFSKCLNKYQSYECVCNEGFAINKEKDQCTGK